MKTLLILSLVAAIFNLSSTEFEETGKVTIQSLPKSWAVFTADHNIVSLTSSYYCNKNDFAINLFFVEGEPKPEGGYDYLGLYQLVGDKAKLILQNGRTAATSNDEDQLVFIGASDGIYVYDTPKNKTEKYGTLTDGILQIDKEIGTDTLYILTEDNSIHKVTEGGNKKTKIEGIENAHEFILDNSNNLYFLNANNTPYVYNDHGVMKIEGLLANHSYGKLVKAPFIVKNEVRYICDEQHYTVYANGTSKILNIATKIRITYALESFYVQYHGFDKTIYKYVFINNIGDGLREGIKNANIDFNNTFHCFASKLIN